MTKYDPRYVKVSLFHIEKYAVTSVLVAILALPGSGVVLSLAFEAGSDLFARVGLVVFALFGLWLGVAGIWLNRRLVAVRRQISDDVDKVFEEGDLLPAKAPIEARLIRSLGAAYRSSRTGLTVYGGLFEDKARPL